MQKINRSCSEGDVLRNVSVRILRLVFGVVAIGLTAQCHRANAQNMNMQWTGYFDSVTVYMSDIKTDASGNIVVAGSYFNTVDFDPGPGVASYTCTGMFNDDAFIAKYDPTGALIWVNVTNSTYSERFSYLEVTANGDIIVNGTFYGDVDLDFGPGVATVYHNGNSDADYLLARYNTNGDFYWAKSWGSIGSEYIGPLRLCNSGNILVSGSFTGTCDMDPGPGVQMFTVIGSITTTDLFFSCFDGNGNLLWTWQMGGTMSEAIQAIAVDASDNIYCTGFVVGTVDMDPGPAQDTLSGNHGFLSRFNSSGDFYWVKTFDFHPGFCEVTSQQEIYVAGNYTSTFDADPGAGTFTITHVAGYDMVAILLDTSGSFIRAASIAGPANHMIGDADLDVNDNLMIGGQFESAADFDPGAGTHILSPATWRDGFLVTLNIQLDLVSVLHIPCIGGEGYIGKITSDNSGNVFVNGRFSGTADFDPGPGTYTITNNAANQATFLSKYNTPTGTSESMPVSASLFSVYPNPSSDCFHISCANELNNGSAMLYDMRGCLVTTWIGLYGTDFSLNVEKIESGMYMLVISDDLALYTTRVVKY